MDAIKLKIGQWSSEEDEKYIACEMYKKYDEFSWWMYIKISFTWVVPFKIIS